MMLLSYDNILYNEKKIGEKIKLTFYRDGKKQTAEVTLTTADQKQ